MADYTQLMAHAESALLYPTDLSDAEWRLIEPLLPTPGHTGRPRHWPLRLILDALFYQVKSGCPWRLLPREYPPWQTVYYYFRLWREDGTWERLNDSLRARLRQRIGRHANPSGAVLDSQSVKTTEKGALVAMMLSRKSRAANAICWWTLKGWCSKSNSYPPICMTP